MAPIVETMVIFSGRDFRFVGYPATYFACLEYLARHRDAPVGISKVSPEEIQKYYEEKNRAAIIQAILVFLTAVPFLWWLRGGLSARSV